MKLYLFFALALAASCTSNDNTRETQTMIITRTDTVYLTRNTMISPANAYSDLFLDSSYISSFMPGSSDTSQGFRSFYNYRNYQYAWFSSHGLTEQAHGFWNLQDQLGNVSGEDLNKRMDSLLENDSLVVNRNDSFIMQTELELTKAFLRFYREHRDRTNFAGVPAEKAIPAIKMNTIELADTLLSRRITSSNDTTSQYVLLMSQLQNLRQRAKDTGYQKIVIVNKKLRTGGSAQGIGQLKARLQRSGELTGRDTSNIYNDSLVTAIKLYQRNNGLAVTGQISDSLITSLNTPPEEQIQNLIVNILRAQWMPLERNANYLSVNIPDFMLTAYENNNPVFEMPVAVGRAGTNTLMFSGKLSQVVFSPYWNLPQSIVRDEILPKMKADPKYLESRNMEITGRNDTLPSIRQKPGKDNAMGRVKFLFPNRYDIYFHDTPDKSVFNKSNRAISHGCIRLQDAEKLANYLLRNNNAWTPEKIRTAMNATKEQSVSISPAVHVVITYYTTWVEGGRLLFAKDIYGNDKIMKDMLFSVSGTTPLINQKDTSAKSF